jgi:hypothetical protein
MAAPRPIEELRLPSDCARPEHPRIMAPVGLATTLGFLLIMLGLVAAILLPMTVFFQSDLL